MSGKSYREYYRDLYVIQDEILMALEEFDFYLTGGTALSRFYFNHRYSDDLDFFIHQRKTFLDDLKEIIARLKKRFELEIRVMTGDFAQVFIRSEDFFKKYRNEFQATLKVDFVNEKELPHFGDFNRFEEFSRVDNLRNMLSNKITAITRLEPKDVADIWLICKNLSFSWEQIIHEAEQKAAIEELMVFDLLKTFPAEMLHKIKWINPIDIEDFDKDRQVILADILTKSSNSLAGLK
ncbi:MAG: nucleotidyl transferase AbiEii/AbiGii toxin family protein [Candidatus Aminicenantes bacterium]|nr:nucleotidyl transferase AbiEii/AbiGii toxin family protein [Candidatus Aminicenantes bacterium]